MDAERGLKVIVVITVQRADEGNVIDTFADVRGCLETQATHSPGSESSGVVNTRSWNGQPSELCAKLTNWMDGERLKFIRPLAGRLRLGAVRARKIGRGALRPSGPESAKSA